MGKIINFKDTKKVIKKLKTTDKTVVLVGGCFDILHPGHLKFLEAAKKQGDVLVVALENDENIRRLKGKGRPVNQENFRAEELVKTRFVDLVIILPSLKTETDYQAMVKIVSPRVIAVSQDDPQIKNKQKQAKLIGGKVVRVISRLKAFSTTRLLDRKKMIILGIETSCDETAAAIVENGTKILSTIVSSSQAIHIKSGGIIPEVAAREQVKCIMPVIEKALGKGCGIDALAVTIGPGLVGSLLVGVETAKTLAYLWHKQIIPVNHLLAHVYANWLAPYYNDINHCSKPQFPLIALIASGGHSELILMKNHGKYTWLGGTRDDAAGECFDKCARLLGLGYPGGPAIAAAAAKSKDQPRSAGQSPKSKVNLPRPMIDSDNFDFSFSGLKTAVLREMQKVNHSNDFFAEGKLAIPVRQVRTNCVYHPTSWINFMAHEIQEAITDVLVKKTLAAAQKHNVKTILLAGGVAANDLLRQKFKVQGSKFKIKFFAPAKNLCTDNAAMVASAAYFNFKPIPWTKVKADPGLSF